MQPAKKKTLTFAVMGVFALGIGAIALFVNPDKKADQTAPSSAPKPALTVSTARPQSGELPVTLRANGNIDAWQEASVGAEADGWRLDSVRVNVGDVVQKGQVLATFAPEMIQADLTQAEASLAEAEANANEAAANAERARSLQTARALSAQQINQYLTAEKTAQARVQVMRAAVAAQQLRLKRTQVLAPDGGIISTRMATVGAVVGSGTELFRMIRQGRLEWRAEVTAAELGRLKPGVTATVTAANGARMDGKVRMIGPTVDAHTRSALVYVDLPAEGGAKAGMFATGEFKLGTTRALTVPQQAVVVHDGFNYVFRLNPGNRVTQVRIDTGRRLGDRVEIIGGVDAAAPVVITGAGFLHDGDFVKEVPLPASLAGK